MQSEQFYPPTVIDGHYEVGMLWKHENPWLLNNRMTAAARLRSL